MVNSKFNAKYFSSKLCHLEKLLLFIRPAIANGSLREDDVHDVQTLQHLIKDVMGIRFRGPLDWINSLRQYFTAVGGFRAFLEKPICSFSPTLVLAAYIEK